MWKSLYTCGYTGRAKGKEKNCRKTKQMNKPKRKKEDIPNLQILPLSLYFCLSPFAVVSIKVNQASTFFIFINSFPHYKPNAAMILLV